MLGKIIIGLMAVMMMVSVADAKPRHHYRVHHVAPVVQQQEPFQLFKPIITPVPNFYGVTTENIEKTIKGTVQWISHPSFAWCGWWMRQHIGSELGVSIPPAYNRAAEWAHFGRPASGPAPGVIAVQRHHVMKVVSVPRPGVIVAISGNDGHAVRTRARSTSRIIAYRWPQ